MFSSTIGAIGGHNWENKFYSLFTYRSFISYKRFELLNDVNATNKDTLSELNESVATLDNSTLTNNHGDPKSDELVSEFPPPFSPSNPLN